MAKIQLPDGSVIEVPDGTTVRQFAEKIGPGLAKAALAGTIDGKLVDLSTPLVGDSSLKIITSKDSDGLVWFKVKAADGVTGWISSDYCIIAETYDELEEE